MVRTVLAVVCAASVNMAPSVTASMGRVRVPRAGKVPRVIDLVTPGTTDPTANTGERIMHESGVMSCENTTATCKCKRNVSVDL